MARNICFDSFTPYFRSDLSGLNGISLLTTERKLQLFSTITFEPGATNEENAFVCWKCHDNPKFGSAVGVMEHFRSHLSIKEKLQFFACPLCRRDCPLYGGMLHIRDHFKFQCSTCNGYMHIYDDFTIHHTCVCNASPEQYISSRIVRVPDAVFMGRLRGRQSLLKLTQCCDRHGVSLGDAINLMCTKYSRVTL